MDLEQGLETKIRHPNRDNGMMRIDFWGSHFRYFQLTLWDKRFEFQSCPPGHLSISDIGSGTIILKIYRKKTYLMIDLNGENQIQLDTLGTPFSYPDCYGFWGVKKINQFKYAVVFGNIETHYRIPGSDESDDSEDDRDKDNNGSDDDESAIPGNITRRSDVVQLLFRLSTGYFE